MMYVFSCLEVFLWVNLVSSRTLILWETQYINISANTVYSYLVPLIRDTVKWQSMDYL